MQQPSDPPIGQVGTPPAVLREPVQRWRLVVARDAVGGDGQREQQAAWEAGLIACGLPLAGLDAPKPKPRFLPAAPLAGSIPGEAELVDVWLVERLPAWRVRDCLAAGMPPGHRLLDLYDVWLGEASLPGRVVASVYRAQVDAPVAPVQAACAALLAAGELLRERRKGEAVVRYDLRPFIDDLAASPGLGEEDATLRMTLRHDPEKGIGRPDETLAAMGEIIGRRITASGLVRERIVLAEIVAAPLAPRRGPRPPRR